MIWRKVFGTTGDPEMQLADLAFFERSTNERSTTKRAAMHRARHIYDTIIKAIHNARHLVESGSPVTNRDTKSKK